MPWSASPCVCVCVCVCIYTCHEHVHIRAYTYVCASQRRPHCLTLPMDRHAGCRLFRPSAGLFPAPQLWVAPQRDGRALRRRLQARAEERRGHLEARCRCVPAPPLPRSPSAGRRFRSLTPARTPHPGDTYYGEFTNDVRHGFGMPPLGAAAPGCSPAAPAHGRPRFLARHLHQRIWRQV